MAGRKPKNQPLTQTEMIEMTKQKRATSKIYKAESDEIKDEAISNSVRNTLNEMRKAEKLEKINLDDTKTVKALAECYLESCAVTSSFPTVSALAVSLGYTRENLYHYMKKKPDSETGKFLIQLHDMFSNILAENSLRNNTNAVVSIFLLKSLFGYKDTTSIELVQGDPSTDTNVDDLIQRAELLD